MSKTKNLGLVLDGEMCQKTFKQWRQDVNGQNNSNFEKIDVTIGDLVNTIIEGLSSEEPVEQDNV